MFITVALGLVAQSLGFALPASAQQKPGLELFVGGRDVSYARRFSNGDWNRWNAAETGAAQVRDIAVTDTGDHLQVFALTGDDRILYARRYANGSWYVWPGGARWVDLSSIT